MPHLLIRTATLLLALALSPLASAARPEPLQVPQAEVLTYWRPVEGSFYPRTNVDPKRVQFASQVTVAYSINKRGRPHDLKVVSATPAGAYSDWALNAVRAMRFKPAEGNAERRAIRSEMITNWASNGE